MNNEPAGAIPNNFFQPRECGAVTPASAGEAREPISMFLGDLLFEDADDYLLTMYYTDKDRAHAEALKLNKQVVYVQGHGTRAYILTDAGEFQGEPVIYMVRPLSGGMELAYDWRPFGTVPFSA